MGDRLLALNAVDLGKEDAEDTLLVAPAQLRDVDAPRRWPPAWRRGQRCLENNPPPPPALNEIWNKK